MLQLTAFLFAVSTDQQTGKISKEGKEPNYIFSIASFFITTVYKLGSFFPLMTAQQLKKIIIYHYY